MPPRTCWRQRDPTLTLVYLPHLDYGLQRLGPDASRDRQGPRRDRRGGRRADRRRRERLGRSGDGAVRIRHRAGRAAGARQPRAARGGPARGPRRAGRRAARRRRSRARSPSPITRSPTSTSPTRADVDEVRRAARAARRRRARARRGRQARVSASTIRAPANWWRSPSRTPGSPTTTGSTTPRAPDFARTVDIHRKPGYDPVELFLDPAIRLPKLAIGWRLLRKEARLPRP